MFVTQQALFVVVGSDAGNAPYSANMKNGKRSPVGERIAQARQAAGLSQVQLAEKLGVTQQMVGYLERQPVAIRPELLLQLSQALDVSVDELLGQPAKPSRGGGPAGKMRRLFEAASKLPRSKQEKILDILQPFVREHANGTNGNS
jgi:transcriptional regulator with XRE-family HTH domain